MESMMNATWNVDATKILSRDEIALVLTDLKRRCRRSVNPRLNLTIFRLATCCGLRASEIAGLTLSHVRVGMERPYILVPKDVAKGGKARRVPLWWDRGTLDDITAWRDERVRQKAAAGDYFVCALAESALGNVLDRRNVRVRFLTACKVLGKTRLAHLTVHHGRHSFVSHALAGGRSLAEVRDAAGHANIATTSIYTHVANQDSGVGDLFNFNGSNTTETQP
jgi:integrase/recombinase XerD